MIGTLASDDICNLSKPMENAKDKIGGVPVENLTPQENNLLLSQGDRTQLIEDSKHPNLHQHPIQFKSDNFDGKMISIPIEDMVNRSFLYQAELAVDPSESILAAEQQ